MRKVLLTLIALAGLGALALGAGVLWAQRWLNAPIDGISEAAIYEVKKGTSMGGLAHDLSARGVVEHPQIWMLYGRFTGDAQRLRAGEYALAPRMTPQDLLDLFTSGDVILHSLTIVEGTTFKNLRVALEGNTALVQEATKLSDEQIMQAVGKPGMHPEGMFFPDTYRFPRGTSDLEILRISHQRLDRELEARWAKRAPDLPLANAYEALILASIIEKETALRSERPLIGGVFVQRLRRGMRLQTDPTVIYGMQERYDGNIRRADLTRDTPYNTYTRAGLPPTPIALVGAESLDAAVNPADTDALFFVATGDPDGSHYFSRTLDEHQAAVQRYLRKLRSRNQ